MKVLFVGLAAIITLGSCVEQRIQPPEKEAASGAIRTSALSKIVV